MKNIIVGPGHPLRGGIANFNESLCESFLKEGIDSEIVSFSLQYPSIFFPGKTQLDPGAAPKNIKITPLINSVNPFSWMKAAAYIKSQNPDYVIIRFWMPFMAPCLGWIARILRKHTKVIAIVDNIIPHETKMGDSALISYFVNSCDAFVAMSQSVLDDLSKFIKTDKYKFLPHPIYDVFGDKVAKSEARDFLDLKADGRYILFFGFIRKYKGLDLLLHAMADSRIRELNIVLIIAGEFYGNEAYYQEIISENKLEDQLILKSHYIPSEEVKQYFCAADMVVQPYKTATQSGITQIAYNFERPMLVTNTGGLAEIVPHNKVGYVTDTNATAIADALVDFYSNSREAEFSSNTIEEKKRFMWEAFVTGIQELYDAL